MSRKYSMIPAGDDGRGNLSLLPIIECMGMLVVPTKLPIYHEPDTSTLTNLPADIKCLTFEL